MPNNTANPEPPTQTESIYYAAMTEGPYYTTVSTGLHTDQVEAMAEAISLQNDELYAVIVAKVTVIPPESGKPAVTIELISYDGDEAERMIESGIP